MPKSNLEHRILNKRTREYKVISAKLLRTGGYNKVFKVKVIHQNEAKYSIFRFPHGAPDLRQERTAMYGPNVAHQVALLRWLRATKQVCVPLVLEYDTGSSILGQPYMILDYIPSTSLDNIYHLLPQGVKIQAARCIADAMTAMLKNETLHMGLTVASPSQPVNMNYMGRWNQEAALGQAGFPTELFGDPPTAASTHSGVTLRQLIFKMLAGWEAAIERSVARGRRPQDLSYPRIKFSWIRYLVKEMDSRGYFNDERGNCIHHWDFWPRNILVKVARSVPLLNGRKFDNPDAYFERRSKDEPHIKIMAIVDWDDAASVPQLLTRIPPIWLWDPRPAQYVPGKHNPRVPMGADGNDADLYGEEYYYDNKGRCWLGKESKEIRDEFNKMMERRTPGWNQDAYGRGRWVRRLWRFLMNGDDIGQVDADRLEQLVTDWEAKKKREGARPTTGGRRQFNVKPQLQQNQYYRPDDNAHVMDQYREGGERLQRWQRMYHGY